MSLASFESSSTSLSSLRLVCRTAWTSSCLLQKSGCAAFFSISRISLRLWSASKITSNQLYLLSDCTHLLTQFFEHLFLQDPSPGSGSLQEAPEQCRKENDNTQDKQGAAMAHVETPARKE